MITLESGGFALLVNVPSTTPTSKRLEYEGAGDQTNLEVIGQVQQK